MNILVTSTSGFIGSYIAQRLLVHGDIVIGLNNHNDDFDPALKEARLQQFAHHFQYKHVRTICPISTP